MFRRILFFAVILLGIATGVMLAFGDRFAGAVARRAMARAAVTAAAHGIELRDMRFARASFAGLGALRCDDVGVTVVVDRPESVAVPRVAFAFHAGTIVVDAGGPWNGQCRLAVLDGDIDVLDREAQPTGSELTDVRLSVDFPLSWWRAAEAARLLEIEVRRVVREGTTRLSLTLEASATFRVAGRDQTLDLRSEAVPGGGSRVALDREALAQLARAYINPLTETEIELVARNPHRAPTLLRITEQASRAARALRQRDRSFPYDAYRHVYWSWLLTREFGPTFAEEVAAAHEIDPTYETGPATRRMDQQNNAVGRAYALAGVEESELVHRVLTDPNVILKPEAGAIRAP